MNQDYNYDFGFELYDGKNNDSLVHTGTIDLYQIVRLVHGFLGDTFTYNR